MQENVYFVFFRCEWKGPSLGITSLTRTRQSLDRYTPNTVIPRDGNFDSQLKPMNDD